eukprot:TRINITY_DN22989_c0_g1_i2.p1 TRINITY_DN22989_c0_g1~~TRINITY_DN22989_c0_g1_i2.p1  ORF type:complete len:204 (-),score=38.37 TRINITY_DN22989_c0_g1_i2:78-689(-)
MTRKGSNLIWRRAGKRQKAFNRFQGIYNTDKPSVISNTNHFDQPKATKATRYEIVEKGTYGLNKRIILEYESIQTNVYYYYWKWSGYYHKLPRGIVSYEFEKFRREYTNMWIHYDLFGEAALCSWGHVRPKIPKQSESDANWRFRRTVKKLPHLSSPDVFEIELLTKKNVAGVARSRHHEFSLGSMIEYRDFVVKNPESFTVS